MTFHLTHVDSKVFFYKWLKFISKNKVEPMLVLNYTQFSSKSIGLVGISGVYGWFCVNELKLYIGSAVEITKRGLKQHQNAFRSNRNLQQAVKKHGWPNFLFIVFQTVGLASEVNAEILLSVEQFYLDSFPSEVKYNVAPLAHSSLGYRHSDKTKAHLSKVKKALLKENPNLGFVAGINHPACRSIKVTDLQTGSITVHPSISIFAHSIGKSRQAVSKALRNGNIYLNRYKVEYTA